MIALSGVEEDLKALNEKLEKMMSRLDYLEAILTESQKYPELAQLMGDLRVGAAPYGEPAKPFPHFFYFLKRVFSFPRLIIGFYLKRRRAVRRFREEMIACGVPLVEANELSKMYSFRIGDLMKMARSISEA